MTERRPALGKGLSALIPDAPEPPRSGALMVGIELLAPNAHQPRIQMDDDRLRELADSIRAKGIIQPILVRPTGTTYQIIAGERRWRAAQRAGLERVPVVIRDLPEDSDQQQLELALIENIQRENLNPIDEATAYQRLTEAFALTQEQIAAAVGKDRSTVANLMRLLKLPEEVRAEVAGGTLSMGHARALLGLADPAAQRHVAREVIARGLSVRDAEGLVRSLEGGDEKSRARKQVSAAEPPPDVHTRAAEERLRFVLGTRVRIVRRGERGTLEIDFASEDELNRIYEHIVR